MNAQDIAKLLAEPFAKDDIGWKPQAIKDNRALAVAYIDARAVMDRLDAVLGTDGWQDDYTFLPDGAVTCKLSCRIAGEWVTKMDVGGQSEQPDEGDRHKAAVSDGLKRAAVKFGIGRYLYNLPASWVDYDAKRRAIVTPPTLPAWALPQVKPLPVPPVTEKDRQKLAELLKAKGKTLAGLVSWLGLPEGAGLGDLSREQFDRAVQSLQK